MHNLLGTRLTDAPKRGVIGSTEGMIKKAMYEPVYSRYIVHCTQPEK